MENYDDMEPSRACNGVRELNAEELEAVSGGFRIGLRDGGLALMTLGISAAAAPLVAPGIAAFAFFSGATLYFGGLAAGLTYGGGGGSRFRHFVNQK